jgi:hypothetical protein
MALIIFSPTNSLHIPHLALKIYSDAVNNNYPDELSYSAKLFTSMAVDATVRILSIFSVLSCEGDS